MKKFVIIFLLMTVFAGCKKHEAKKEIPEETKVIVEEKPMPSLQVGCFVFADDENEILLKITEVGDEVKTNLSYALAGKDRNEGTFVGVLKGDKLMGIYTFSSEGVESDREVAFLVKGDRLIEGFGELNETGSRFKDKEAISYTSAMPLIKTDCDE